MKIYQYAARAHRDTRAGFLVCEKTFDSKNDINLCTPEAAAKFLDEYADASELPNEKTWMFCFDGALRLLGFSELTQGVHDETMFDIKRMLQIALLTGACAITVAHNHPSGSTQPSQPDLSTTKRIREACDLLGIRLLDHVIVGYKGWMSFAEQGLI
jgi:DNA repair protein RadC